MANATDSTDTLSTPGVTRRENHTAPRILRELLTGTGVAFNGPHPHDIQVRDPKTYRRILAQGSLGFGEAYMDDLWECEQLDVLFERLLRAQIKRRLRTVTSLHLAARITISSLLNRIVNRQSQRRAFMVGEEHYDTGNDIFELMLDRSMSYSCGYWAHASDLQQAQHDKLDMICRKLKLQAGELLLDIGCGWGGLAHFAATNYGVRVMGITVSREQQRYAQQLCAELPVQIRLADYRDLEGRFDKIVSVGMFEHVGPKNYTPFFNIVNRLLTRDGLMLLHSIGVTSTTRDECDPWINRYIFPNGKPPSAQQIAAAIEPDLVIRDWHEFGADYDRTLMAWWERFENGWPHLREKYSRRFYRMWKYYLHCCAGAFRAGDTQLWQIVISRHGEHSRYHSIRP